MIFITSPRLRKSSKDKKIAREKSSLHPTHSPTNKQKRKIWYVLVEHMLGFFFREYAFAARGFEPLKSDSLTSKLISEGRKVSLRISYARKRTCAKFLR